MKRIISAPAGALLFAAALLTLGILGALHLAIGGVDPTLPMAAVGLGSFLLKDADSSLKKTKALPARGSSASTDGIDLGITGRSDFLAQTELQIEAPALAGGDLSDGDTVEYKVEHDDNSDFSAVATLYDKVIVQTGAGGSGADAETVHVRLPLDVKQHVRVTATHAGSATAAGDPTDKSVTAQFVF